jgi:hypothetical protein
MANKSTNINETIASHLKSSNNKKNTTTYDIGDPGSGLKQAQECGGVKLVNGITKTTCVYMCC